MKRRAIKAEKVRALLLSGGNETVESIALKAGCSPAYVGDVARAMRKEGFAVRLGHVAPHRPRKQNPKTKSASELLAEGKTTTQIAQILSVSGDDVKAMAAAKTMGLDSVPLTWAGAYRRLAEFARDHGDATTWGLAQKLAEAKGMKL